MEKIDYLIEYLLRESDRNTFDYANSDKKSLYRALVNVRQANPISNEFLRAEDEYLQEELQKANITNIENIKTIEEQYKESNLLNSNKICLWRGDITKLKIEAAVNAGNSQGLGCFVPNHNCIDNQINTFAGVRLRLACNEIMKELNYNLETGKAIITKGYNLPSKYVIQTVGPIIENEVTEGKKEELSNCYKNSLSLAVDNEIRTIAFPYKIDKVVFNLWSDEDVMIYEQNIK